MNIEDNINIPKVEQVSSSVSKYPNEYASFGFDKRNTATHCSDCKEEGMINVCSRLCPCGKYASFGFKGNKVEYCKTCKTEGMINVRNKMCKCRTYASFGFKGDKVECCKKCKRKV